MSPEAPKSKEEEYFLQVQMQQLKDKADKFKASKKAEELEKLKQQHWMRCPKCGMELKEIAFRGVAIDECFSCGGAFLDAGELEQIAAKEGSGGVLHGLVKIIGRVR
jgi:protein-arginine kinase activator protein McsA